MLPSSNCLALTSHADVANAVVFGKEMGTWLIFAVIFFGLTVIAFVWVWVADFVRDREAGKPIEKPWD